MKKIKLILLLFVAGFVTKSFSQSLQWAKAMGGTGIDGASSIALDASGNVYSVGYFYVTADFDPGVGTFNLTSAGINDIFISKLDGAGNFVWAKAIGGTGFDAAVSIVLDASGNVYITGSFSGTVDFDPGVGTFNLTSAGNNDIFISKLDGAGNFVWAKAMGGSGSDNGYSLAIDASGNFYITGNFDATADFDPGAGTFNLPSAGFTDIFISKLDGSGNFVWAKAMGGTSYDGAGSIALDASGNVYTTGGFNATADFDPGAGTFNLNSTGNDDVFISKLDGAGNFVWAKAIGGLSNDEGRSLTLDASGNVYTTGYFSGTTDFDPGAGTFNLNSAGNFDIFISKLDGSGNFVWAKATGGVNDDVSHSITLDASGNIYTAGYFSGTVDFDPGAGTYTFTSAGNYDFFISKLDGAGNFVWAKAMGGTNYDSALSLALDASGNIYTTGYFTGTANFDPGPGTFNLNSVAGSNDIFVSKYSQPVGINEITQSNYLFKIYPTPSEGQFTIQSENTILKSNISVTDILGKEIYYVKVEQLNNTTIDLSNNSNGIYFVQINSEKDVMSKKIIINH